VNDECELLNISIYKRNDNDYYYMYNENIKDYLLYYREINFSSIILQMYHYIHISISMQI